jgi:hypothetical protein
MGGGEDVTARKRTVKGVALEEVPAVSCLSPAHSYHDAASELFSVREQRSRTAHPTRKIHYSTRSIF